MFVITIANYHDLEFKSDMPKGVILDVTPERATVLKNAGMAVDFDFKKVIKEEKKIEKTVEETVVEKPKEAVVEEVKKPEAVAAEDETQAKKK